MPEGSLVDGLQHYSPQESVDWLTTFQICSSNSFGNAQNLQRLSSPQTYKARPIRNKSCFFAANSVPWFIILIALFVKRKTLRGFICWRLSPFRTSDSKYGTVPAAQRFTQDIPGPGSYWRILCIWKLYLTWYYKGGIGKPALPCSKKREHCRSKMQLVKRKQQCNKVLYLDIGCRNRRFPGYHATCRVANNRTGTRWTGKGTGCRSLQYQGTGTQYSLFIWLRGSLMPLPCGMCSSMYDLHGYSAQLKITLWKGPHFHSGAELYLPTTLRFYKRTLGSLWRTRHLYHFHPEHAHINADAPGLKVNAVHPMWFDSFYVSMLVSGIYINKGRGMARAAIEAWFQIAKPCSAKAKNILLFT